MTTAAEPDGAPRLAVLDILRGIAILGILFMNINDMGASLWASFDDVRHLGWGQGDQIAWWLREIFANGTARCLLEMLFGAGMVILTSRVADGVSGWRIMGRYYMRNIVLFLFGCVHIFILLWPGDILHTYGLAALVAFLFRRLRPGWLIAIGLSLALLQLGGGSYGYYQASTVPAQVAQIEAKQAAGAALTAADKKLLKDNVDRKARRAKNKAESKADIAAEDKARSAATGDFMSWAGAAWAVIIKLESQFLEIAFVWEAAGTMLIGAALFKMGILQGKRSPRFYGWLTFIAYAIGLSMRAVGAYEQTLFIDGVPKTIWATQEIARILTTLGHIGLVNLLVMSAGGAAFLRPFVAAGRTALSVYIAQTLICLWVLYPPFMLGLYGKMTWGPLMLTALVVNLLLLWLANIWVKHFDIAPVEWAWRSIIEGRALPWRKRRAAPAVVGASPLPA